MLIALLLFSQGQAQSIDKLNHYKYVVIPMQFSFQNKENQYLLSSRLNHLFQLQGFNTLMKDAKYPSDLAFNRCLALYVDVKNPTQGFMSTHTELQVILRNCYNEVVYKTKMGKSRYKHKKKAYKEALEHAFDSFSGFYYRYNEEGHIEHIDKKRPEEKAQVAPAPEPLAGIIKNTYERNGVIYEVVKIEAGFLIRSQQQQERVAFMVPTEKNSILYSSKTVNGTATLAPNGNIVVEYFDRKAGKTRKLIYQKQ